MIRCVRMWGFRGQGVATVDHQYARCLFDAGCRVEWPLERTLLTSHLFEVFFLSCFQRGELSWSDLATLSVLCGFIGACVIFCS